MQIQIEIISVGAVQTIPTKGGKSYQCIEVAYRKDGKIEGKKIMSFVNPTVFKAIQEFSAGDTATVETVKGEPNAAGQSFWQWQSISYGGTNPTPVASSPSTASAPTKSVSNYETREERQAKQVFIVRQSSISNAITLVSSHTKDKQTVGNVLAIAKQFEQYVFGVDEQPAAHEIESDDIPL